MNKSRIMVTNCCKHHPIEHYKFRRYASHVSALAIGLVYLLGAGLASAAETVVSDASAKHYPLAQIFTFLFLMLGPFKIIGVFAKMTKSADAALIKELAFRSIFFSVLALLIAGILGEKILSSYGIPVPILALSAGIILFLVALTHILQQFLPSTTPQDTEDTTVPTINMALMPLAFPTVVTPYGIATLVVFLALSPSLAGQLSIGAIALGIMLMNLAIMLVIKKIPPVMYLLLTVIGAVLGVVQVALGILIINNSLKALGVL
jgi:multiple antibiotic resistance protein